MRMLIHILACSFYILVVYGENRFGVDADAEDRFWLDAKVNAKSLDSRWTLAGEVRVIILFRGAADRLGLKVRPYQGTGVGQIHLRGVREMRREVALVLLELVARVVDGSAAYQAGVRDGDVLLKLDERDVATWRADPGKSGVLTLAIRS